MLLLSPERWSNYALIDSGGFEKLERFGAYVLARPEPKVAWGEVHQVVGHTHDEETQQAVMHNGKQLFVADALPNEYLIINTQTHKVEVKQP